VRYDVHRRSHAGPEEGDGQRVGEACRQNKYGPEPDLERTDVLDEVLVVGIEPGQRREEGSASWMRPKLPPSGALSGTASQPRIGGCRPASAPKPRQPG
jgi:hypothetical protein